MEIKTSITHIPPALVFLMAEQLIRIPHSLFSFASQFQPNELDHTTHSVHYTFFFSFGTFHGLTGWYLLELVQWQSTTELYRLHENHSQ